MFCFFMDWLLDELASEIGAWWIDIAAKCDAMKAGLGVALLGFVTESAIAEDTMMLMTLCRMLSIELLAKVQRQNMTLRADGC